MSETQVAINKSVRDFLADAKNYEGPEGQKIIEIRTGEAQVIEYPVKVSVAATPSGPFEFYRKRVTKPFGTTGAPEDTLHDRNKMHLLVDRENGKLSLIIDENYEKGTVIVGSIQKNKFLEAFSINTNKTYSSMELAKLLKTNKMWFADPNQCGQMVHNLQHFEGQWDTKVRSIDNQKGVTAQSIERNLKSEIPLSFGLTIEPFKGFPRATFGVDICVNYNGSGINFYLESVDLMQLQLNETIREITDQVEKFNDEIAIFEV